MEEEQSTHDTQIWMLERRIQNLRALRAGRTAYGSSTLDHRNLGGPFCTNQFHPLIGERQ